MQFWRLEITSNVKNYGSNVSKLRCNWYISEQSEVMQVCCMPVNELISVIQMRSIVKEPNPSPHVITIGEFSKETRQLKRVKLSYPGRTKHLHSFRVYHTIRLNLCHCDNQVALKGTLLTLFVWLKDNDDWSWFKKKKTLNSTSDKFINRCVVFLLTTAKPFCVSPYDQKIERSLWH